MAAEASESNDPLGGLLHAVVFAVDGAEYLGADVVLAAERSGEWSRLREHVRQGLACQQWLADSDHVLTLDEVESAAREFRYERDLISGEEMEAWLEQWALTLETWTDCLQRAVLRRTWATDLVTRYPANQAEIDACLGPEAIASGCVEDCARDLAGRAAAWGRAREERWLPDDDAADDRKQRLERIDAGFREFRARILSARSPPRGSTISPATASRMSLRRSPRPVSRRPRSFAGVARIRFACPRSSRD